MFPNLSALVGEEVADALVRAAGGIIPLAAMSDTALRQLVQHQQPCSPAQQKRQQLLRAGILVRAPIFTSIFGGDEADDDADHHQPHQHDVVAARKAATQLSRKTLVVAKVDAGGGRPSGDFGRDEAIKLRDQLARLATYKKVSAADQQALPVPEVHQRGEAAEKKRGGRQEHRRRVAGMEGPSVMERALGRVKMGVSEETQREELLQRTDLRVALMQEQQMAVAKEARKRQREEPPPDEYDDLGGLML